MVRRCECGCDTFGKVNNVMIEASGIGGQNVRGAMLFCSECGKVTLFLDNPKAFAKEAEAQFVKASLDAPGPYR